MARKSKDLFVLLAERHQRRTSTKKDETPSGKASSSRASEGRESSGKDMAATAREVGGALGRWVQGAVRTMRSDESAKKSKSKARRSTRPSRRNPPRQVPRGLLVPGWLLVGMVTVALGGGFLIGKFTTGLDGNSRLDGRTAQKPREFDRPTPGLTEAEETAVLAGKFYVVGVYFPGERVKAATLARDLRDRGVEKARILFRENGSISRWATVCYVAPSDDKNEVLATLQRLAGELGFEVAPGLYKKE